MNDKIYPSMVIRSQAEAIKLLEKENKELQNKIHTLEDELEWYKQECDDLEMRIGLDE